MFRIERSYKFFVLVSNLINFAIFRLTLQDIQKSAASTIFRYVVPKFTILC